MTRNWVEEGEYGIEGAMVDARWTLLDMDGKEITRELLEVEIAPDEYVLCKRAGGNPDCDHEWDPSNEGGDAENPGCWDYGGGRMIFASRCAKRGIRRVEHDPGSQRDPGEHRTVTFETPE